MGTITSKYCKGEKREY